MDDEFMLVHEMLQKGLGKIVLVDFRPMGRPTVSAAPPEPRRLLLEALPRDGVEFSRKGQALFG